MLVSTYTVCLRFSTLPVSQSRAKMEFLACTSIHIKIDAGDRRKPEPRLVSVAYPYEVPILSDIKPRILTPEKARRSPPSLLNVRTPPPPPSPPPLPPSPLPPLPPYHPPKVNAIPTTGTKNLRMRHLKTSVITILFFTGTFYNSENTLFYAVKVLFCIKNFKAIYL